MSIIASAKAKSRELAAIHIAGARRVVLAQMLVTSALVGLDILAQRHLTDTVAGIAAGFAMGLAMSAVMLWQLARLAALTSPNAGRKLSFFRPFLMKEVWIGAFLMRLVPQLLVGGFALVMHEKGLGTFMAVLVFLFGGGERLLSMTLVALAALLLMLVALALNVAAMQMVIRAVDEGPVGGGEALRILRNGVRYVLSPVALFFSYAGWYALILVLFAAALVALGIDPSQLTLKNLAIVPIMLGASPYITSLAKLIAGTWILGAGVYLWPRFFMTQAVYQRRLLGGG